MATQTSISVHQVQAVKITLSKTFDNFTSFDVITVDKYGHQVVMSIFSDEPITILLPSDQIGQSNE